MLFTTPWWIYLALVGIVFSAYMIVRTSKEEKQVEDSFIEREGQVYIDRINNEKELRKSEIKKVETM